MDAIGSQDITKPPSCLEFTLETLSTNAASASKSARSITLNQPVSTTKESWLMVRKHLRDCVHRSVLLIQVMIWLICITNVPEILGLIRYLQLSFLKLKMRMKSRMSRFWLQQKLTKLMLQMIWLNKSKLSLSAKTIWFMLLSLSHLPQL